jgi:hypothetical protein
MYRYGVPDMPLPELSGRRPPLSRTAQRPARSNIRTLWIERGTPASHLSPAESGVAASPSGSRRRVSASSRQPRLAPRRNQ